MKTTRLTTTTVPHKVLAKYAWAAMFWRDQMTDQVLPLLNQLLLTEAAQTNPELFRAQFTAAMLNTLLDLQRSTLPAPAKRPVGRPPKQVVDTRDPDDPARQYDGKSEAEMQAIQAAFLATLKPR